MISAVHGTPQLAVASQDGVDEVIYVHATGLCKETWAPVIEELGALGSTQGAMAMDQRGHGDSEASPPPYDWWDLGRDVLRLIDASGMSSHIGVGHSSGAAALLMAEILRPGTFSSLVTVEPIVFPGPYRRVEDHPLSVAALRRKSSFPSRDAARENFSTKLPFSAWDPRALDVYLDGGFRTDSEGRLSLKCRPEIEAEFYCGATEHGAWERLGEISPQVTLLVGEHSDTHQDPLLTAQAEQFRSVRVVVVPGTSHFVPMERPDVVAKAIEALS